MDPKVMALASVVKDQFSNGGEPFRFDIYINRQISQQISEGDYIIYLVFIMKNIFLQIKEIDHTTVINYAGYYSDEQLSM